MEITENSMKLRRQYVAPQITEIIDFSDTPLMGNIGSLTGEDTGEYEEWSKKGATSFDDDDMLSDFEEDGNY